MPDPNIEILKKETYLRMIENSVGSMQYRNLFVRFKDSGAVKDVLNNGEYSCAFFVSSVLVLAGLMDTPHATVNTVVRLLEAGGWKRVDGAPEPGDVLSWEPKLQPDGTAHGHVGFAVGNREAVSTDSRTGLVARHHETFGVGSAGAPTRPLVAVFRFDF